MCGVRSPETAIPTPVRPSVRASVGSSVRRAAPSVKGGGRKKGVVEGSQVEWSGVVWSGARSSRSTQPVLLLQSHARRRSRSDVRSNGRTGAATALPTFGLFGHVFSCLVPARTRIVAIVSFIAAFAVSSSEEETKRGGTKAEATERDGKMTAART